MTTECAMRAFAETKDTEDTAWKEKIDFNVDMLNWWYLSPHVEWQLAIGNRELVQQKGLG